MGGGEVKLGRVKAHMGILRNKAADVFAKNAAEGVPSDDHEKWMSGGRNRQWAKQRKENVHRKARTRLLVGRWDGDGRQ